MTVRPPIAFGADGRDPSGLALCAECGYPHRGPRCENPACFANLSPARAAEVRERVAAEAAARAERERIAALRGRAMEGAFRRPARQRGARR